MIKNIRLKGAKNTRDFGTISCADKRLIRPHCFIRSAALNELSGRDIEILKNEYRLSTVIDLRTDTEIEEKPDIRIDGVEYIHIPVFTEETGGITHSEETDKKELLKHLPDLSELYRTMVSDKDCVAQLKRVFEIITRGDNNAVLWHCTEGKDRCGIVSALFLLILDVDINTIYEDYLFTNNAPSRNRRKYYFLIRYLMRDKQSAERIKRLFSAEREYLDSAFDTIRELYGSTDIFLRDYLGVTEEIKQNMKSKFLY